MKRVLLILTFLLASAESHAQLNADCLKGLYDSVDIMTGARMVYTKKPVYVRDENGEISFVITVLASMGTTDMMLTIKEPGKRLINENATINVLYQDGTRDELHAGNSLITDGSLSLDFIKFSSLVDSIILKKLRMIRIYTYKGFYQTEIPSDMSMLLSSQLSCLKDVKTTR